MIVLVYIDDNGLQTWLEYDSIDEIELPDTIELNYCFINGKQQNEVVRVGDLKGELYEK